VFLVRYELGSCSPEDYVLYSHRSENLKSYTVLEIRYVSKPSFSLLIFLHDEHSPETQRLRVFYFIVKSSRIEELLRSIYCEGLVRRSDSLEEYIRQMHSTVTDSDK
jgi:hypothetical protein